MMYRLKRQNLIIVMIVWLSVILFPNGSALAQWEGVDNLLGKPDSPVLAGNLQSSAPMIKKIAAKRWYVNGSILFEGDGKSWSKAFRTIAKALGAAGGSDEIWVRMGTYVLDAQLEISEAVQLYGGFAGTERFLSQRRPSRHPTILDGAGETRAMYVTADALIDSITIQNCTHLDGVPIDHPAADEAFRGGAVMVKGVKPIFSNCKFVENFLDSRASFTKIMQGIIYVKNAAPQFRFCQFTDNWIVSHSGQGAAIFNDNSDTGIFNCSFVGNVINVANNASGGNGGAIYNLNSSPVITECRFFANECDGNEDVGGKGGAIYNHNSPAEISRCWFEDNVVNGEDSHGGAIYNFISRTIIENCGFYANICDGFWDDFDDHTPVAAGGAIFNNSSSGSIINCTIVSNMAIDWENYGHDQNAFGGGIYNQSCSPTVVNSILWANTTIIKGHNGSEDIVNRYSQIYDDGDSYPHVSHSDIDQKGFLGEGNIRKNPLIGTALHLTAKSPCRGLANSKLAPPIDIDGEKRFTGDKASDMGFDEFVDSDRDGMPDVWEVSYQLNPYGNDAGKDPDRDGWTNLQEYERGTNPRVYDGPIIFPRIGKEL